MAMDGVIHTTDGAIHIMVGDTLHGDGDILTMVMVVLTGLVTIMDSMMDSMQAEEATIIQMKD